MNNIGLWAHLRRRTHAAVALVREAFSAVNHDFTRGPIRRSVILLAIPMVLEMAMESVFAITDMFYVARLGRDAVATVGLTEAVMTLVYAVSVGLGMGVTAVVSRRVGEHDDDGAAFATGQTLWLGAITSAIVAVVGITFAGDILQLMGADGAIVASGSSYTRILLGGAPTVVLIFLLNAAFRGAGLAGIAMRALALANGVNIILDPCLIFGLGPFPQLGLTGAAIATLCGRTIGVCYLLNTLYRGAPPLSLQGRHLVFDLAAMFRLVSVSFGGTLQFLVGTVSWVLLVRLVASYGSAAIAGYTIAIRIVDFTLLPVWGLSNAAATLVGQNLGAGEPARAEQAVTVVMRYTLAFTGLVALCFISAAEFFITVFSQIPEIIKYGCDCLRFISYGYAFFGAGLVLTQAFNGAGDTYTPTWINFICFWILQLPVAWLLADAYGYGPRGVFVAITMAEVALAVVAWSQYRKGRWQLTTV